MNTEKPLLGSKYVPKYYGDYFDRPWLKKDLIEYFDYCEYSEMAKDPTKYFEQKKRINFDIIHHECRGDPLQGSYKNYQTVYNDDIKKYPENEKKDVLGGLVRNLNRKDLFVEEKVVNEHFQS